MPVIKIELRKGLDQNQLTQIIELVGDAVVNTLKLPADDRNIRLTEYDSWQFKMKAPYEILIEISMFAGRSKETKKLLFQNIVERLENNLSISKEKIFILIHEQPLENWGVRGGIPASEIQLGFNINI